MYRLFSSDGTDLWVNDAHHICVDAKIATTLWSELHNNLLCTCSEQFARRPSAAEVLRTEVDALAHRIAFFTGKALGWVGSRKGSTLASRRRKAWQVITRCFFNYLLNSLLLRTLRIGTSSFPRIRRGVRLSWRYPRTWKGLMLETRDYYMEVCCRFGSSWVERGFLWVIPSTV